MVKYSGEVIEEELSVTRAYAPETVGRLFTPMEIGQMKEIVGGFGNTTFGTIAGIASGAGTAFSVAWSLLGFFGVVPTDASRHAEIMSPLAQIQGQISQVQATIDYMRGMLDQHRKMINDLGIKMDQFYLNDISGDMINLTTDMEKITYALNIPSNKAAIEAIIEEIAEEYKTPIEAGRELDPDELAMLAAEDGGIDELADGSGNSSVLSVDGQEGKGRKVSFRWKQDFESAKHGEIRIRVRGKCF